MEKVGARLVPVVSGAIPRQSILDVRICSDCGVQGSQWHVLDLAADLSFSLPSAWKLPY